MIGLRHRTTPDFSLLRSSSKDASRIHARIRSTNTRPEVALRTIVRSAGLRPGASGGEILGRPDITFPRLRLVVFADGDFWHGRHWKERREKLLRGSNADYWLRKIETNMERDRRIDRTLRKDGWVVLRLWETDILRAPERCKARILRAVGRCR